MNLNEFLRFALVVPAYNRPQSLLRMKSQLESLVANYKQESVEFDLIVSLDFSSHQNEMKSIAQSIEWSHGSKRVIVHESRLGLKNHILKCGDLVSSFDAIIILEDDLLVSKYALMFCLDSYLFSKDHSRIAGVSLYSYKVSEYDFLPFSAKLSHPSFYLLQFPSSWGQMWTKSQWCTFRNWFNMNDNEDFSMLPNDRVRKWPATSWKKHFIKYMYLNNLFFLFPHMSFTSNPGEHGENHNYTYDLYSNEIVDFDIKDFLKPFEFENLERYDCTFEVFGSKAKSKDVNLFNRFFARYPYRSTRYFQLFCMSFKNDFRKFKFRLMRKNK